MLLVLTLRQRGQIEPGMGRDAAQQTIIDFGKNESAKTVIIKIQMMQDASQRILMYYNTEEAKETRIGHLTQQVLQRVDF